MRSPSIGVVSLALLTAACANDQAGTANSASIAFNVATRAAAPAAAALSGAPDTLTDGTNVLVIDTAQLVIRDIKLHLVNDDLACTDDDRDDDSDDDSRHGDDARVAHLSDDDDDDDCDEIRIGPYLLDLPLGPGAARQFTIEVPAGSYREVKFKVHKATREGDRAFIAQYPELADRSVRVVGTWNGTPFSFTSDVSASQESEFNPPLEVADLAGTDLTLFVDLSTWFMVNGSLVDPGLANDQQPLSSMVKNNIKASIRAFRDHDRDGCDDDDDDDRHGDDGNRGPGGTPGD